MAIIRNGNPKNIAIHHSAVNPPAMNMTELKARAKSHNNYHKTKSIGWNNTTPGEFGYPYIRYHYMIAQDGSVLQVQHEKYVLYHSGDGSTGQFNYWGIAIELEGNYEEAKPTEAMMKSLVLLIRDIEKRYNIDPMVRGHKEISATTSCPGINIGTSKSGWLKQVIDNVNDPNYPLVEVPSTPNCDEYIKKVSILSEENEALKIAAQGFKDNIKLLEERVAFLEADRKAREEEMKILEDDLKREKEERERFEKQYMEAVTELNELKAGKELWIKRLADILYKLFRRK